jgi:hypothetical protein
MKDLKDYAGRMIRMSEIEKNGLSTEGYEILENGKLRFWNDHKSIAESNPLTDSGKNFTKKDWENLYAALEWKDRIITRDHHGENILNHVTQKRFRYELRHEKDDDGSCIVVSRNPERDLAFENEDWEIWEMLEAMWYGGRSRCHHRKGE